MSINHYSDIIMGAMASQITSLTFVVSTVYSDQRKHQSSASLAFVQGIHRWPVNSPRKWPVTRKIGSISDNHYIQSTSCDYYLEDSFNDKFGKASNLDDSLSFFHQNIKSLPKHQNELEIYLDSLNCNFFPHWSYWNLVRWIQGSAAWYFQLYMSS